MVIKYDIRNDIMTSTLMSSAATLGSAGRSSGLAASLPSLCCPGPALRLADTLAPDPLSLCYEHHPGAAPAITPHPDVHLVEPAAVAQVPLRVGGQIDGLKCAEVHEGHILVHCTGR
jgi:hypothetical protein